MAARNRTVSNHQRDRDRRFDEAFPPDDSLADDMLWDELAWVDWLDEPEE